MKRKGFVMMETLVVMTALTIGLISIYSSYSVILSRAKISQSHENSDKIYKTYFISNYIKENIEISEGLSVYSVDSAPSNIQFIMQNFDMEKLYIFNTSQDYTELINNKNLDGSSIAYFNIWDEYEPSKYNFVAKFKTGDYPREVSEFASIPLIDDAEEAEPSIATNGLISWLDLVNNTNDSSNRAVAYDLSGNNNNCSLVNFKYNQSSGWTGTGLYFDGTGDYVKCELGSYRTLEFLINPSSGQLAADYPTIFNHNKQTASTFVWLFLRKTGGVLSAQVNNTSTKDISNFYENDKDAYITVVFNTNNFLIYKNGELIQTYNQSSIPPSTGESFIGIYDPYLDHAFKGEIKLFRAYDRALTSEEIKNNYKLTK